MKTLFLIRHAKSDWEQNLPDFERPLNARGLRDAPLMAERLGAQSPLPDLLVSSSAKRALTTAQLFASALGLGETSLILEKTIYEANIPTLLQVVDRLDDRFSSVALFGHNPGMSLFTHYLCPTFQEDFPTCAIVQLQFEATTWQEISGGTGELRWFSYPKLV